PAVRYGPAVAARLFVRADRIKRRAGPDAAGAVALERALPVVARDLGRVPSDGVRDRVGAPSADDSLARRAVGEVARIGRLHHLDARAGRGGGVHANSVGHEAERDTVGGGAFELALPALGRRLRERGSQRSAGIGVETATAHDDLSE